MRSYVEFCDPDTLERSYLMAFLSDGRVPQNLFYLLNGANAFYTYRNADLAEIAWRDEVAFFQRQALVAPGQDLVFVSLGCGNAGPEKMLLRHLEAEGYNVRYVGVDSSMRMLELADENLSDEAFARHLVLADFGRLDFGEQLDDLVHECGTRVYAMIGGTFGNFDQTYLAGLLSGLISERDYLYLDVVPLEQTDEKNVRLRDRLSHLPENLSAFFDHLLAALGLSVEHGRVITEEMPDKAMQTLRQTFLFEVVDPLRVSCLGEELALVPGQRIELLTIRAYDIPSLIGYLGGKGFDLLDSYEPDVGRLSHRWQRLLFRRV
ncbi:MAG: L-histidine N(alpha)-methyltransferase [Anaerolineae bacterium]|nr:L-histidine N(alpha)-methyltransferase [Anaerolineae bacterium]